MESQTLGHKYAWGSVSGVIEDSAVITLQASEREKYDRGAMCIRNLRQVLKFLIKFT